jgi:4-oxalocrotonate tautomerase
MEVFMPTIFFYGPKLEKEKRKEMIRSFTETASRLTGIEKSAFVVYLRESSPEDVGVGGELLEDRLKSK